MGADNQQERLAKAQEALQRIEREHELILKRIEDMFMSSSRGWEYRDTRERMINSESHRYTQEWQAARIRAQGYSVLEREDWY